MTTKTTTSTIPENMRANEMTFASSFFLQIFIIEIERKYKNCITKRKKNKYIYKNRISFSLYS